MVSAGCEGKRKFGFLEEASYCPCLRLLIYELVKEISHLSLSLSLFSTSSLFSLSLSLSGVQLSLKSATASIDRRGLEE